MHMRLCTACLALACIGATDPVHAQALQTVQICYVDSGGLNIADAEYDPATGRATMTYQHERVEVDYANYAGTHVGGPYASEAEWYTNGEAIEWNGHRYEKFGLPRVLGATDIVLTGRYERVPIFAEWSGDKTPEMLYIPIRMHCEFQPYRLAPPSGE